MAQIYIADYTLERREIDISEELMSQASTSYQAAKIFNSVGLPAKAREEFWCLYLNNRYMPIGLARVSQGTINTALVHPALVFGPAIKLLASAIVTAHNHPGGDTTPTLDDKRVDDRLKTSADILGMTHLDSLILATTLDGVKYRSSSDRYQHEFTLSGD